MNTTIIIENLIKAGNAYDAQKYLDFYLPDAVLDDLSVGRQLVGHKGIREYFDSNFIGYMTQTKLINLDFINEENAHLEVEFTGGFPE